MGLHKLIHTGRSSKFTGWSPANRAAARAIIASEKDVRAFEHAQAVEKASLGASVISQAYLQVGYVGNMPSEDGHYFVVDLSSESTDFVTVHRGNVLGTRSIPVERFNLPTLRWFLLGKLTSDDFLGLEKLPTSQETRP